MVRNVKRIDMSSFIDNRTIQTIMDKEVIDVKEIVETTMTISPFGFPGKRTYRVQYITNNDDIQYHIIKGDEYNKILNHD